MPSHDDQPVITLEEVEHYDGAELYLFIGISTGGSGVHRAFPRWSPLFRADSVIRGVDLPEDAPAADFRRLVLAMRDNDRLIGAVVTSHKLRLFRAISDLVDHMDPLVSITHEINSLDTRDGRISAYARDAQSLDLVLETTGTEKADPQRPVTCIGAGGSAIALMLAMRLDIPGTIETGGPLRRDRSASRGPLTILGRRESALAEIAAVARRAEIAESGLRLLQAEGTDAISASVRAASPGSLVANATGLGKLSEGSPLSGPEAFPVRAVAGDFNYRGPLTFLAQARGAGLVTEDGWDYFLAGWAAALAAISEMSLGGGFFHSLKEVSRGLRPERSRRPPG